MKPISMQWLALVIIAALLLNVGVADDPPSDNRPVQSAPAPASATRRAPPVRFGETRYGWKWLAARYDKDAAGEVTRHRFPGSEAAFICLDRNWDGKLTPLDFDWSENGVLSRQKETTFALFKSADTNSDGRLTAEEWQAVFARAVKEGGTLNDLELEQLIFLPAVKKAERQARSKGVESFLERQKKSKKAPELGELAPDFSLRSPDGQTSVQLSSFQGKRPVVLIFGSFT